jgi:hypothetical protein
MVLFKPCGQATYHAPGLLAVHTHAWRRIRLYDGHEIAHACRACRVAEAQPEVAVGIHSIFERSDRPLLVSSPEGIADDPADLGRAVG